MKLTARHGAIVFTTLALTIPGLAGAAPDSGSSSATVTTSINGVVSSANTVLPKALSDCPAGYACCGT